MSLPGGPSFEWTLADARHSTSLMALSLSKGGSDCLTSVLIEAVKEQQEQIRQLQSEMEALKVAWTTEWSRASRLDER